MKKQELIQFLFMYKMDCEVMFNVGGKLVPITEIKRVGNKIILSDAYCNDDSEVVKQNIINALIG